MNSDPDLQYESSNFDEDLFNQLLAEAKSGNERATHQLIAQFRDYLLLMANMDLDPALKPKIGASDVVQQSMLAIHQNLQAFRGQTIPEFMGWIRKILQNDLLNTRRTYKQAQRRQVDREIRINDSQAQVPVLADRQKTPQAEVLLKELAVEMERCLAQLSDSHRNVIKMRNWQEKSFNEIGAELDCSPDAARKLWFRAFENLKQVILASRPEFASHLIHMSSPADPG